MLYPQFLDLVAYKHRTAAHTSSMNRVKSTMVGDHHSPFRGQGLEFDSVRPYVPGDDIRNIDWRVTARAGTPHLKIFREERERHRLLCIDMNASMRFGTRKTFKSVQAAHAAALLGWAGLAQHDCVSGCLFGDVPQGIQLFPPKRTSSSFASLLKTLSEPTTTYHHVAMEEALEQINRAARTGSLIYLISDFMEFKRHPHLEATLSSLNQRCDMIFIAVNDPADQSLPSIGTLAFSQDQDRVVIDTDNPSGRKAYADRWDQNRQALYHLTARYKVPLIELSTESDIKRDLLLGLKMIAYRKYS